MGKVLSEAEVNRELMSVSSDMFTQLARVMKSLSLLSSTIVLPATSRMATHVLVWQTAPNHSN